MFTGILIPASWFSAFATHFLLVNSFFPKVFNAVSGNISFNLYLSENVLILSLLLNNSLL